MELQLLIDILQSLLGGSFGYNLSILLVGVYVGSYLGKKEVKGTSEIFLQDYRDQKTEIWAQLKRSIN